MAISLTVQIVRVKRIYTRKNEFDTLDAFSDKEDDLHEVLNGYLRKYKGQEYRAKDSKEVLEVKRLHAEGRQLEGFVDAGPYGSSSDIRNLDTFKTVAYRKGTRDVDMRPFYFLFDLPEGRDRGFLILQQTGGEGVQSLLFEMLRSEFDRDYPEQRLRLKPYVPKELVDQVNKSPVAQVRFAKYKAPSDLASEVLGRKTPVEGTMELIIKFREDSVTPQTIRNFLNKHQGGESVLELEGLEFPYDHVKIQVNINGKRRTMDVADPTKLRPSFDVTEQLAPMGANGHPRFAAISQIAKEIMSDINSVLYPRRDATG